MDLSALKSAIHSGDYLWKKHSLVRLAERNITQDEALEVILNGDVIEEYPDDQPYPSCLMFEEVNGRPLHLVVALDPGDNFVYIITVYEPSLDEFKPDYRTRRN